MSLMSGQVSVKTWYLIFSVRLCYSPCSSTNAPPHPHPQVLDCVKSHPLISEEVDARSHRVGRGATPALLLETRRCYYPTTGLTAYSWG